jgi:hypothetical protein
MKLQNEAWRHRKRRSWENVKRLVVEFEPTGSLSSSLRFIGKFFKLIGTAGGRVWERVRPVPGNKG